MIEIGKFNRLTVLRKVAIGVFLDGGEAGDILLPRRYVPPQTEPGAEVDVFLYHDSEDRLIATTEKPLAQTGEFALLKVVAVTESGIFLDWGLAKDLFLPYSEVKGKVKEGQYVPVYLYTDERSGRILASSRLNRFTTAQAGDLEEGQEVELFIYEKTTLGYSAVINGTTRGILYTNEIFRRIKTGERTRGYIKRIREDGKVDICLDKPGYGKVEGIAEKILDSLQKGGGFLPVSDNSPPELIYKLFGVSKKSFKKATGALYKQRRIDILDEGIKLIK